MVYHWQILPYTVLLLRAWYISLLLVQIMHMLFMLLVSLLHLLLQFTGQLFFVFYDIFVVRSFKVFYPYPPLSYSSCILWCWSWQWSHRSQICYRFLYLSRWFSYFLEEQETIYCFSFFSGSRISCYDIYYKRDCLVTLVTCWYESFSFSFYSYVLWQPEFYSDCLQLGFSWTN